MKQRESVYRAVTETMGTNDKEIYKPTKGERAQIQQMVVEMFEAGDVDFSDSAKAKYDTTKKLGGYVSGLVSNWLRKDLRLNGGVAYVAANPGSRAGQGDAQIRELRKLLKLHIGTPKEEEIQGYITARQDLIKKDKAKAINIDPNLIPAALRDLVNSE